MRCAPTSAAFAISCSCSSLIVASAAAHDTGLPPNVLACAPGGHVISSARASATPSGSPDAMPLAMAIDVGLDAACARSRTSCPVRPMPDCTSSTTSRMPCSVVSSRSRCRNSVGRDDVAAFALDRLDDDRRHFVGRHQVHEQLVLDEVEALGGAALRRRARADSDSSRDTARGTRPASTARSRGAGPPCSRSATATPCVRP